jgi:transposase
MEPTNRYHLALAEAAHARGHQVYLIDPYCLSHYGAGLGRRAKTDPQDARLLARFLEREAGELRPWTPLKPGEQRFWRLLKRRAALVRCKVQLHQSLGGLEVLQEEAEAAGQSQLRSAADECPVRSSRERNGLRRDIESIRLPKYLCVFALLA